MMKSKCMVAVSALVALGLSALACTAPVQAQDSIIGTWRYVAQMHTEVDSHKVVKPFGENPSGHVSFTKGGYFITVLFGEGRPKPAVPLKNEDRIKLFNTLAAGSGTYKVEGNTLTLSYETSWHELWNGTVQKRTFDVTGSKLTITSAPAKNAAGVEVIFTLVLDRVE